MTCQHGSRVCASNMQITAHTSTVNLCVYCKNDLLLIRCKELKAENARLRGEVAEAQKPIKIVLGDGSTFIAGIKSEDETKFGVALLTGFKGRAVGETCPEMVGHRCDEYQGGVEILSDNADSLQILLEAVEVAIAALKAKEEE